MNVRRLGLGAMSVVVLACAFGSLGADCNDTAGAGAAALADTPRAPVSNAMTPGRGPDDATIAAALIAASGVTPGTLTEPNAQASPNVDTTGAQLAPTTSIGSQRSMQAMPASVPVPDMATANLRAPSASRMRAHRNANATLSNAALENDAAILAAVLLARARANQGTSQIGDAPVVVLDGCDGIVPDAVLRANIIGNFEPQNLVLEAPSILRFEPAGLTGMRSLAGVFQTNTGEVTCILFNGAGTYAFDASANELAKGTITVQ